MCAGTGIFCVLQIVCEHLRRSGRSRKRSSESRLSFLFVFWFWVSGFVSLQFPEAGSSRRSAAGPDEVKSCDVDVEDELVPELDNNPGFCISCVDERLTG